ncbi:oxidoreductase, partial [Enterococcus hirae]
LAGLLLKVGAYGLLRIAYGVFPDLAIDYAGFVAVIGVISIIYGGMNALALRDLKRMVAYSSVSHMGFVLVGLASLTSIGFSGSLFH